MQLRRVLYQIKAILLTCHDEALEKQYEQVEQELQKQIEKTNKWEFSNKSLIVF